MNPELLIVVCLVIAFAAGWFLGETHGIVKCTNKLLETPATREILGDAKWKEFVRRAK